MVFSCHPKANTDTDTENNLTNHSLRPIPFNELPKSIAESSGLEIFNGNILTLNDSGGANAIYVMNDKGKDEKKVEIKDSKNHDWESLAANDSMVFIGDFGNNIGNRKNLAVYALSEWEGDKADNHKIDFEYKNQTDFRKQNHSNSFDCEAMIALEDELILFSKDWLNQRTEVYHIPIDYQNNHQIEPSESMDVGILITGADYDASSKTLVLSGYMDFAMYIWVFKNARPNKMLTKNNQKFKLAGLQDAQVEGIAFMDSETVLISTERTNAFKQQLWTVKLP